MDKINIAIIDSNLMQRSNTYRILEECLQHSRQVASLSEFGSGPELIQEIALSGRYDIYIMEVTMPAMNGILLAEQLRANGDSGIIIFLTHDLGSAYRAFGVKASDYLLKSEPAERITKALDEAFTELNREYISPVIELKLKTGLMRVPIDDITHVDIVDRALCFHLRNGQSLNSTCLRGTFNQAISENMGDLSHYPDFIFAGKSQLINLSYVMQLGSDRVVLITGETITIPKSAVLPIRQAWLSRKLFL